MGKSNFTQICDQKFVANFVKNNMICHFGVPESIITENGANVNTHLMKDICEQFKITHRNSTAYRQQMNGAVEAASKNIKRILRKMIDNYENWQEQLPYALLGYRTTTRTSAGVTPYLFVYGTKAVIPTEVEIPSLRIIQEVELNHTKWVKNRYEQLAMIDGKRMLAVCHRQLYRQTMSRAFNKRVFNRTASTHQPAYSQRRRKANLTMRVTKQMDKAYLTMRVTKRMNDKDIADQRGHAKNE
ncbi:uncharacterized protein LOC132628622 [Lycium barbarum]|uniref:uncharacterized protein LOC132628622 n=1 Tax=Lycium barbarum TaxID=112863 RepID=UPI00293EF656|nr:uncharacterized protein LOC132628622 [Lycium barbarum]